MSEPAVFYRSFSPVNFVVVGPDGALSGVSYIVSIETAGGHVHRSFIQEYLDELTDNTLIIPEYSKYTMLERQFSENERDIWRLETDVVTMTGDISNFLMPEVNFNGSLLETIQRMIQIHLWKCLCGEFENLFLKVELSPAAVQRNPNHVPLSFVYPHKYPAEGLQGHAGFIEWTHSDKFRTDCYSCQTGVQHLMFAIQHIQNSILVNRSQIIDRDGPWITTRVDGYTVFKASFNSDKCKLLIWDAKDSKPKTFIHWFVEMFRGSLEMAHVEKLWIGFGPDEGACIELNF